MKSFVAGVVIGFAASCAVAFASSTAKHNGVFWNQLNRTAKDGYVNGYDDAMRVSVSKLDTMTRLGALFHWKRSRKIIQEIEVQLSIPEIPPEDTVNRLDTLYKNQQYRELDLASALLLMTFPETKVAATSSAK